MASSDDNLPRKGLILGLGAVGAIVVIGGAVALFTSSEPDRLVILKADTKPVKIAPDDPGGLKINSIDSPVMSLLEKKPETEEGVEVLRPPVTEPELPPIDVAETAPQAAPAPNPAEPEVPAEPEQVVTETAVADNASSAPLPAENVSETATAETAIAETAETEPASETAATATAQTSAQDKPEQQAETETGEGGEIDSAIASLPTKKPTPKIVNTTDINSPSFVVQFAAFKDEKRAKNTAAVLSTKHESRLGGLTLGYMKRGEYWRVLTEPMPRAEATSLCSMFRSVGQDCITKLMEQP